MTDVCDIRPERTVAITRVALLFVAGVQCADHTYNRIWIRDASQGTDVWLLS